MNLWRWWKQEKVSHKSSWCCCFGAMCTEDHLTFLSISPCKFPENSLCRWVSERGSAEGLKGQSWLSSALWIVPCTQLPLLSLFMNELSFYNRVSWLRLHRELSLFLLSVDNCLSEIMFFVGIICAPEFISGEGWCGKGGDERQGSAPVTVHQTWFERPHPELGIETQKNRWTWPGLSSPGWDVRVMEILPYFCLCVAPSLKVVSENKNKTNKQTTTTTKPRQLIPGLLLCWKTKILWILLALLTEICWNQVLLWNCWSLWPRGSWRSD